jgi:hypothetical protein
VSDVSPPPPPPPPPPPADPSAGPIEQATALIAEKPEARVGAAFAGGLLFALILKRLAR